MDITKLFEVNVTLKNEGKGTWIALYISKQIVDKMSEKLSVKYINNGA